MLLQTIILLSLVVSFLPLQTAAVRGPGSLTTVTVCEVLKNHQRYNGKTIAVIGQFGATEEGYWLSDYDCPVSLETDHLEWPKILWLEYDRSAPALSQTSEVDLVAVRRVVDKLSQAAQPREPQPEWVVVIGKLEFPDQLETVAVPSGRRRIAGFGHMGTSPGQLIYRQGDIKDIDR